MCNRQHISRCYALSDVCLSLRPLLTRLQLEREYVAADERNNSKRLKSKPTMSSNNQSAHIDNENATHSARTRRGSLTCAWDCGEASDDNDLAVGLSDSNNDIAQDNGDTNDMILAAGGGIGIGAGRLAPPPITDQVRNSHSTTSSDATAMDTQDNDDDAFAQTLVNRNPAFASVNESVGQHLTKLLQTVRKKSGKPLATSEKTKDALTTKDQEAAYRMLSQVPPFSYLPNDEIRSLVLDLYQVEYEDGEVIVGQNDTDDDVYVLAQGRVVMVQLQRSEKDNNNNFIGKSAAKFVGFLDAPAYFGEWGVLFDAARNAQVIAGAPTTRVYRMTGNRFAALYEKQAAFRLKLALGLRQHGIFRHIDAFIAIVRRAVAHDTVFDFHSILKSYRKMVPAIHANLHSSELDIEGWTYAVRRLPDTITSTYVYLLANHIPMPFMHPKFDLSEVQVKTAARRRQAFALDDHGKLLVIMRENYSDVLDFLSLLCAHVHESSKLRTKLVRPSALHIIHECLWTSKLSTQSTTEAGPTRPGRRAYATASLEKQNDALQKLPLTQDEKDGLVALWPDNFLYRVWDIITLHENIQIRSDLASAYVESTDRWAESIRKAVNGFLCPGGETGVCFQTELTTHIISSNTTSVRNLISPFIHKNKSKIEDWGKGTHPDIMSHSDLSESDKLCALCNAYMRSHPEARKEQDDFDKDCFKTLRNTEMTGIQVELIDLNALEETYAKHDIAPDPFLSTSFQRYNDGRWSTKIDKDKTRKCRLLVNIDYAFGKQAEQLISALALLFEQSLSSVGVMGKAGGLQGRRGDIIVADYLLHQEGDEQTLIDNTGVDREALHSLSGRDVHSGGVLTVIGTLLQDSRLLSFYKKLYGCVSLEMEGSFYARELRRFKKAGLLAENVRLRFLYYVSDTPLSSEQNETLSQDMSIAEVIPPQYSVTRALLYPLLSE